MTHVEFVADWIRREWLRQAHVSAESVLAWEDIPGEHRKWTRLAQAALDADASWRPGSVNVVR